MLHPNKWVDNYSDGLYGFALKRLNNNQTQAEDIVQEVFLSAWKSRDTYNKSFSEKTWLYSICKNKIIDYYRKENKVQKFELGVNTEDDKYFIKDGHFNNDFKPINNWSLGSSSNKIMEKEFFTVLQNCKQKLKTIQEQVFSLKYLEDIEPSEICLLLEITNQNYWVIMHRAKVQLRTCLEKNWINS